MLRSYSREESRGSLWDVRRAQRRCWRGGTPAAVTHNKDRAPTEREAHQHQVGFLHAQPRHPDHLAPMRVRHEADQLVAHVWF